MKQLLEKLLNKENLHFEEAHTAILWIMSEEATPVTATAFLSLLQSKGATVEEIAGAATAMRERSETISAPQNSIDTCSTGGNGISTFNISTCAALIASAAGATVVKHGNKTNTRKSGSAEALQALGVNIEIDVAKVGQTLEKVGLCFCYAIKHHPAMRFAGPIRKELAIPTIFNVLGPLTNPGGVLNQLLGVPSKQWTTTMAEVLQRLGSERAVVVHGADGLCELTTTADTYVTELREGTLREYTLRPQELGFAQGNLAEIQISSPQESATIIQNILEGVGGTARDVAVLNTAGALIVAGIVDDFQSGIQKAIETIDSGKAKKKLADLIEYTKEGS